jgi:general secretion pathway protein L
MPLDSPFSIAPTAALACGVWRLGDDTLIMVEAWDVGPTVVLVPTEAVLLLVVDLPLASASQRRAALPFAIEDRIADPLDAVHVVLGQAIGPQTYLAAVVRHDLMAGWVATLAAAGLSHARIVPDALALPVPPVGSWHIMGDGDRIVARTDSGTGFAVPAARFAALWMAGGSLPCAVFGADIGLDLPMATLADAMPDRARLGAPPIDLRAGPYAAPARALPRVLRRAAAVVSLGLLAHTLILATDAHVLGNQAAARRTATEVLLRATLPGTPLSADLDRLLPGGGGGGGQLLPLLARVAVALDPVGDLAWTKLGWSAADNSLTLGVEAGDIGGLQRAQAALAAAGLAPVSGAVTAGQGRAVGDLIVRATAT